MDIIWKGVIGGIVTTIIAAAAKKGTVLPGIMPLFPTFALIALYIVGMKQNASDFQETCLAGLKTIPAYLTFLVACYFFIPKLMNS